MKFKVGDKVRVKSKHKYIQGDVGRVGYIRYIIHHARYNYEVDLFDYHICLSAWELEKVEE